MRVFEGLENIDKISNAVITQGTFDGVHVGHRGILNHVINEAKRLNGDSVLITLYPHPRFIIQPEDNNLKLLTTLEEKKILLEKLGIDILIVLPFDEKISNLTPLEYVRDLIVKHLNPIKMIVGYDHRFGKNREGSMIDLEKFGEAFGFMVEQIDAKTVEEITVSSTKIRKALEMGNIALANQYLGYSYTFSGSVERGMQLGRKMGYKTANIQISDPLKRAPGNGIYAARAILNGKQFNGMLSIGTNPTIEDKASSIEMHLFEFNIDIYNQTLSIILVKKIRDEVKFDGLDELKAQLEKDERECREILMNAD
jgi:riboflavin kinase/FMN adenylyltransferase